MANLRPNLDAALFTVLNVSSLTNLATGGVFNSIAPQDTAPPYVVYQSFSKVDDYYAFSKRGGDALYMVKAVTQTPWPKDAATIDSQIDTLLQDATLSITGFTQFVCRRESDIYLVENVGGEVYQHQGGMYRIVADET